MHIILKKLLKLIVFSAIFNCTFAFVNIGVNAAPIELSNINLVILFNNDSIDNDVKDIIINSGGTIINEYPELGGIEVCCSKDLIPKIKARNSVNSLAPNHIIKLSDNEIENKNNLFNNLNITNQWDIDKVTNNGKSFNLESGNHSVVVGIIDSGVDIDHPDLINNFLGGENLVPNNFNDNDSETGNLLDINDRIGHGTEIAGIIAANGNIKGVAPNIAFKSYRVFDEYGDSTATILSSAIVKATNDHVNVINLSMEGYDLKGKCYWIDPETKIKYDLGNNTAEYALLKRAVQYALKHNVTVVAAAGNKALDCSNKKNLTNYLNNLYGDQGFKYEGITYEVPGSIDGVITVSATTKNNTLASYSNYGKDFIDIAAPGGDISDIDEENNLCLTTTIDDDYTYTLGTSIAAPKVSAVAALIICKHKGISPKIVERKICRSADSLGVASTKEYYGSGLVNAYNALQ